MIFIDGKELYCYRQLQVNELLMSQTILKLIFIIIEDILIKRMDRCFESYTNHPSQFLAGPLEVAGNDRRNTQIHV